MAKLKFGAWIPSYSWPDVGPDHGRRLTETIKKCEAYGIDIWVIDHTAVRAGPVRHRVARAAHRPRVRGGADHEGEAGHRDPRAARPASGSAGQGDRDADPPHERALHLRRRPWLVRARVRGDGFADRGARPAHRRD